MNKSLCRADSNLLQCADLLLKRTRCALNLQQMGAQDLQAVLKRGQGSVQTSGD